MVRTTQIVALMLLLIISAAGIHYLKTHSPEDPKNRIYPSCPFRSVTGWKCAGCGTTRALHHLLNGQMPEAFLLNPLLFTLAPVVGMVVIADALVRRRGKTLHAGWLYGCAVAVAASMVARNLLHF